MSFSFYNVYVKGLPDAKSKKAVIAGLKQREDLKVFSLKHGFSFINAIPYLNVVSAFSKRCYFTSIFMFFFSYFGTHFVRACSIMFPDSGIDLLVYISMLLISGFYFHALIEREMIFRSSVLVGTYLARNQDDAIRKFFAQV